LEKNWVHCSCQNLWLTTRLNHLDNGWHQSLIRFSNISGNGLSKLIFVMQSTKCDLNDWYQKETSKQHM
jgi:hypothetical protein